jgi:hypothetical protein
MISKCSQSSPVEVNRRHFIHSSPTLISRACFSIKNLKSAKERPQDAGRKSLFITKSFIMQKTPGIETTSYINCAAFNIQGCLHECRSINLHDKLLNRLDVTLYLITAIVTTSEYLGIHVPITACSFTWLWYNFSEVYNPSIYSCMYVCMYVRMYVYIHTYIYIYIYTHTHTKLHLNNYLQGEDLFLTSYQVFS